MYVHNVPLGYLSFHLSTLTRPIATLCVFRGEYLFFYGIGCGNWFPYLLCSAMVFTRLNQSFDLHRVETFAAKLRNPEPVLF